MNNSNPIECKPQSECAHVPKRAYNSSAGYDLWAAESQKNKNMRLTNDKT